MNAPLVYIADDEEIVLHALELFMGTLQVSVRTFSSASSLLDSLSADWRGCVLIDLKLSDMSGLELMTKIQARNKSLALVLMTGHGDESALRQAIEIGAVATLEKPFSVEKLKSVLRHTEISSCDNLRNDTRPS